jgi:hypothetical protein
MIEKIATVFKPDIIILDTLINFLPQMKSKATNDYSSMADSLMDLQVWTYTLGASTIGVHHVGKERQGQIYDNVLDKTLGSTAIIGNTTSAWNLSKVTEDPTTNTVYICLKAHTHATNAPPDIFFKVDRDEPWAVCDFSEIPAVIDMMPDTTLDTPLQDTIFAHIQSNGTEFLRSDIIVEIATKSKSSNPNVQKAISKLIEKGKLLERKEPFPSRKRWLKCATTVN